MEESGNDDNMKQQELEPGKNAIEMKPTKTQNQNQNKPTSMCTPSWMVTREHTLAVIALVRALVARVRMNNRHHLRALRYTSL